MLLPMRTDTALSHWSDIQLEGGKGENPGGQAGFLEVMQVMPSQVHTIAMDPLGLKSPPDVTSMQVITIDNFDSVFIPTFRNLDLFKNTLSFRERKSNLLDRSLESVLNDLSSIYNELESIVLFHPSMTMEPIAMNKILLDIYKQLTGACFSQFKDLLDFFVRIIKNYIKLIKANTDVKGMNKQLQDRTTRLNTAVAFLNRKIRDYIEELNSKAPDADYSRELDFIDFNLRELNL